MINEKDTYKKIFVEKKCCIVIPIYNNSVTISKIIDETLDYTESIIVVNDGSTDDTELVLKKYPQVSVLGYKVNKGKGYALRKAFKYAYLKGFEYAITIDSDGQHDTKDYEMFLKKLESEGKAIIVGSRNMEQESVPGKSNFGRKFSNFWFKVETGIKIQDSQSGFRLYPLRIINNLNYFTNRYEFEIEVLVRAAWKGCGIVSVPVKVYYASKETRISHFRPLVDFTRISILNTVLFFLAVLFYRPLLFFRKIKRGDPKKFLQQHLLHSNDSNIKLSFSVAVGIITGILPIWGYQLILAIALAYLFKLNKVITIVAANISIPPMIPIILYGSFLTGKIILGDGNVQYSSGLNFEFIKHNIQQYIVGSIVFALVLGTLFGLFTYLFITFFRKKKAKHQLMSL